MSEEDQPLENLPPVAAVESVLHQPRYSTRFKVRNKMRSQLRRHGTHCAYCRVEMVKYHSDSRIHPTRDHIIQLGRGGLNVLANITMACRKCNHEKGMLDGEEYMAWRHGLASRLDRDGRHMRTLPVRNLSVFFFGDNSKTTQI
jgi:5-methylcytosine-specific restriction endonuclease McrA